MTSSRLKLFAVIQLSLFIVLVDGYQIMNDYSTSTTARPSVPAADRERSFLSSGTRQRNLEELLERFDCGNGHSVPKRFECNGVIDCWNRADESNCTHVRFDCGNGHSVPNSFLCDGDDDCLNGADERNCTHGEGSLRRPTSRPRQFGYTRLSLEDLFRTVSTSRFDCGNGNAVSKSYVCDRDDDCGNGADERNCSSDRFDCGNGYTVPQHYLCDGEGDCRNGADERNCNPGTTVASTTETTESTISRTTPTTDRFDCGNGNTVPQSFLCDRDDDCRNGADERNCGRIDCGNGNTVPQRYLCDGDNDCGNGADERNCNPGTTVASTTETTGTTVARTTETRARLVVGVFFECGNERFVRVRSLCNGIDDCGNFADETNCNQGPDVAVKTPPVVTPIFLKDDASIQSPNYPVNYPPNSNVLWNVSTVPGHRIKVVFQAKDLESSRNCSFDRLTLYDGHELSSSSLGVYCNHHEEDLPEPVLSSSNAMLVQFTSDNTVSWKGFQLALTTVCGGTLVAQPSENVFLSHPKFGEQTYGENNTCDWIIKSRQERNVQITFSDFHVGTAFQISNAEKLHVKIEVNGCEDSDTGDCVQYNAPKDNSGTDFVEIYDGPGDSSKIIGKYSGDQTPPVITSRGEELLIRFRSGDFGNFRGFRVVYQEV